MRAVLLVSIGFTPNVGGIETHFDDLVSALNKKKWKVFVLTYKPITIRVKASIFERRGSYTIIYRIPWLGGMFYKFVKKPVVEFLYLTPGLFFVLPFILLKHREINVIHSNGLVAGFVSVVWGRVFNKRVVTTTHSIYGFPKSGFYTKFGKWIFNNSDEVLTLSKQSKGEILQLGVDSKKIDVFTYWVDLSRFRKVKNSKKKLGWKDKFVVLFVGRLVPEKGINVLLESLSKWNKNINLAIIGTGPLESKVRNRELKMNNLFFLGKVDNDKLPIYYSASDLVIVPSVHEEGFGRVILESLSCGTPVIGSYRGAIPEAMDETVGKLIDVSAENVKKTVEHFFKNSAKLGKLSDEARKFAVERYSEKNVETIIDSYQG